MDENRSSSISKTDSEEAIGEFWDNHDFTDFDSDAPDAEFEVISTIDSRTLHQGLEYLSTQPDIPPHITYTLSARLRRGRQASTGAVTFVAMHAGPSLWGPLSNLRETQLRTLTS